MSVQELFQDNELVKKANEYIRRHKVNELFEVVLSSNRDRTCALWSVLSSLRI